MQATKLRSREEAPRMLGALRESWFVACPSSRAGKRPTAVRVLDEEVVVFRDAAGVAHALRDRCCHRGVQLSLGYCVEGNLACRYHGWQFDGTGRCVRIPSLTEGQRVVKGVEVPAYACAERDGYVWVWMGSGAAVGAPRPIPHFEDHRWIQGTTPISAGWVMGLENNLDITHVAFAHPWLHPLFWRRLVLGRLTEGDHEFRPTADGMELFAPATPGADDPSPERPMYRWRYEFPDRLVYTVSVRRWFHVVVLHVVPTGEDSCRFEWLIRNANPLRRRITPKSRCPRILVQDRALLESAQQAYAREGGAFERSVLGDAPNLLLRQVVALGERGQWTERRSGLPARRVIRVRI